MEDDNLFSAATETLEPPAEETTQETTVQETTLPEQETQVEHPEQETQTEQQTQQSQEEPEATEFKGAVSARLRNIVKQAPELGQVFKKYPKLQDQVEAVFRRDAASREIFPTLAEARLMRETFPNGQPDVQALLDDAKEIEELDKSFDFKDRNGEYPGHKQIVQNFFERDRSAGASLMRTAMQNWPQLDRESYNEVMGAIVGVTLSQKGVPEFIAEIADEAKGIEQAQGIYKALLKLHGWADSYSSERPAPSEQEQRLTRERQSLEQERSERDHADQQKFHNDFVGSNKKIENDIIQSHPAIKKLLAVATLSEGKKGDIVNQIRETTEQFLSKSPSFMRKLRAAYGSRNISETSSLIKATWSQPWLLNRMVRTILAKEVPQMVQSNREAVARRASAARPVVPARTGDRPKTPSGPHKIDGRWYKGDGTPFTSVEILAGKHEI